tara:strand:- start:5663 stop:21862 length:16200 start_codon:yes stop_codon:yes gene_type:complete
MDGQGLKVYNGTTLMVSGSGDFATTGTWYHIAIVRNSGVTQAYVNGAQIGSNYVDTNDYLYNAPHIGSDFNQSSHWTGHIDNLCIKKGVCDFITGFTPPTQVDFAEDNIVLGIDGEGPFIASTTEVWATYTGQRTSSTTAKRVDYDGLALIASDIDTGRKELRDCAEIIDLNGAWIAEEAVGRMKAAFVDFTIRGDDPGNNSYGGTNLCIRDTKDYILGALIKDLQEGGDFHTIYTARTYLTTSGKLDHITDEILQSLYTWNEVFKLCETVITTTSTDLSGEYSTRLRIPNNFSSPASSTVTDEIKLLGDNLLKVVAPNDQRFREGGFQLWKNRDYIAEEVAGYIQNKYQQEINEVTYDFLEMPGYGQPYCERDIKQFILPAVMADLVTGGTYQTEAVIDKYLDSQNKVIHVDEELNPMLDAFEYCKMLCMKAVNNLLLSSGEAAAELGVPTWVQEEYYAPQWTARAAYRDDTIVLDTEGYPQAGTRQNNDRYLDAADLIWKNRHVIAKECVSTMNDLSKYENLNIPGGHVNCEDDVLDMIEAMVHDLRFDCNEKTYDAAALYIETENNSLKHIEGEWEASITVVKILRDITSLIMRNAFGRDYEEGGSPDQKPVESYEQNPRIDLYKNCGDAIDGNIRYIAEQAVAAGLVQFPNLNIPGGPINCVHDVTDILRALVFNIKYGGNNWLQYSTEFYATYSGNLDHVTNAPTETNWIMNKARDFAIRAMKGQIITNEAGHVVDQRFYDAVPRPTTTMVTTSVLTGAPVTDNYNNLVTRSFKFGEDKISTTDTGTGIIPDEDAVFSVVTKLPSSPIDCCLFEAGGGTSGVWFGIRDGGTWLRLRAGNGTNSYTSGASYTADTGLAMLDLQISNLTQYFDDGDHELVWQIVIGGNQTTGAGSVTLWIDGQQIGQATTPGGGWTGLTGASGLFANTQWAGFGVSNGSLVAGEAATINTFTVNVGPAPTIAYDITAADYDSSTGDLILNVGNHNHTPGTFLRLISNSLTFTCDQDNHASNHTYPRSGDPAGNTAVEVLDVGRTEHTATAASYDPNSGIMNMTIEQHGMTASTSHTAKDAAYDPDSGVLTITLDDHGFKTGDQVKIHNGSLIFTCAQDNHATKHGYPRQKDPAGDQWLLIEEVTPNTFKVNVGATPKVEYNVSDAVYDQNDGELTLDIGQHRFVGASNHVATFAEYNADKGTLKLTVSGHGVIVGDQIQIMENSMTFTCSMDNHYTNHVYPRSTDPCVGQWLDVVESDIPGGTFTVNVGQSPIVGWDPSDATYNSETGHLTLEIGNHSLAVGTHVKLSQESLNFTCSMDDHATIHSYPRDTDPTHNEPIQILATTATSITVPVGTTPTVQYTPTNATFTPADGLLELTLDRKHTFRPATIHNISGGEYNGSTGMMRVTVADHGFSNGDFVKIADGGITFSCTMDGNASNHAYPRASDPYSNKWLAVRNASKDSFDVYVGRTPELPFTITDATFVPSTGHMRVWIGDHDLVAGDYVRMTEESIGFTCLLDNNISKKYYPRSSGSNYVGNGGADPFWNKRIQIAYAGMPLTATTGTSYNPTTGVMSISTDAPHGMSDGDEVKIATDSLVFTCLEDNNQTNHTYPRATDPFNDRWMRVSNTSTYTFDVQVLSYAPSTNSTTHTFVQANVNGITKKDGTITLDVGASSDTTAHTYTATPGLTPTAITHNPVTGIMDITVEGHKLMAGDFIKIADNSLTFTCAMDNHASDHVYPRPADPASGSWLKVLTATTDTFTVQVLKDIPQSNTTTHLFKSAVAECITKSVIKTGGVYDHTYVTSSVGALRHAGDSVRLAPDALTFRCDADGQASDHVYPRSATTQHTPSDVVYNPNTGNLKFTVNNHGFLPHSYVKIADNSLTFTCAKDDNATGHLYPRPTDPVSGKWVMINDVSANTFTVEVLDVIPSTNTTVHTFVSATSNCITHKKDHFYDTNIPIYEVGMTSSTPSNVSYNPTLGEMVVTVNNTLTGCNKITPDSATYYPATGILRIQMNGHPVKNGQMVWLQDGAFTFRCDEDGQASDHAYPRPSDPASNKFLKAFNVGTNTIDVNVGYFEGQGAISNQTTHVFQSGAMNGVWHANSYVMFEENAVTFQCTKDNNATNHSYPRPSDPSWNKWLPVFNTSSGQFSVKVGKSGINDIYDHTFVSFATDGLKTQTGTIKLDVGNGQITNPTTHVFQSANANSLIGGGEYTHDFKSTNSTYTVTDANYLPATGIMTLTIPNHGFQDGESIKISNDSLVFTCLQDAGGSEHSYPRYTDPVADKWIKIHNCTDDTFDVQVLENIPSTNQTLHTFKRASANGVTRAVLATGGNYTHKFIAPAQLTPTNAVYDPSTGVMTVTVTKHGLKNGTRIKVEDGFVTFTCGQDSNQTNHSYPRASDPFSDEWMKVSNVTTDTFDIQVLFNIPSTNTTPHTFVSGKPKSITVATLMKGNDSIKIADNGLTFTCSKDGNSTEHTYPRPNVDPSWNNSLRIVDDGVSRHTPTDASYTATTGVLTLTVPNHGWSNGQYIRLEDYALDLTCTMDDGSENHAYPRGTDPISNKWLEISNVTASTFDINVGTTPSVQYTPADASYDPYSGHMELNIGAHPLKVGQSVKLADGAVTFSCDMDMNASNHAYPRTTVDTFTPTAGAYDGTTGYLTLTLNGHGFDNGSLIKIADNALTATCEMDGNSSGKTYPRSTDPISGKWKPVENATENTFDIFVGKTEFKSFDPQQVDYNPATGNMVITVGPDHGITTAHSVYINRESMCFTCAQDGHGSDHFYPRPNGSGGASGDDPAYQEAVAVTAVDDSTITVNVNPSPSGASNHAHIFKPAVGLTPQNVTYSGVSGVMTVTYASHGMITGEQIMFEDNSLIFTCGKDDHATEHAYPRHGDPASNRWLTITRIDDNRFTVKVLDETPSTNTSAHTFKYAKAGAMKRGSIRAGGSFTHTFTTFASGGVSHKRDRAYDHSIEIKKVGHGEYTATGATYNAETGVLQLTINGHPFANGNMIKLKPNSLIMTCDMDNNATKHSYPRKTDFAYDRWLEISNKQTNTIDVNVGKTPRANYLVSAATFDPTSGDMELTIGKHGYHGGTTHTVTNGTYDAITGKMVITVPDHGFIIGDRVKFVDNSISFKCGMDGYDVVKSYPRPTDPAHNTWLEIDDITLHTFSINVGTSPKTTHNVTNANYNPTSGVMELTIGSHNLDVGDSIKLKPNSLTFTCDYNGDGQTTQKTYPRSSGAATANGKDYAYDAALVITAKTGTSITVNVNGGQGAITDVTTHTWAGGTSAGAVMSGGGYAHQFWSAAANGLQRANESVYIENESLVFKCNNDGYATEHKYPRANGQGGATADDPYYDTSVPIVSVGDETITVNVGKSSDTSTHLFVRSENAFDVSGASFVPGSGELTITMPSHPFTSGDKVMLKDQGFTFTCQEDNDQTTHSYPRASDPASNNTWLTVTVVDASNFKVNVGTSSNVTTHTWVSSLPGAVIRGVIRGGGVYAHTFDSFVDGGVQWKNSTISLDVGESPAKGYGVSGASFVPATGLLTMTIGNHQLKTGMYAKIANKSMVFRCDQDSQQTDHVYPRPNGFSGATGNDPAYNNRVEITSVSADSITVDVGTSSNTTTHYFQNANNVYTPTFASYDPTSGLMNISIPGDTKNVTGAAYNPTSGTLELTIGAHTLTTDDVIKLKPNSLTFTCDYGGDGNVTQKTYPRAQGASTSDGKDYAYDTALAITAVDQAGGTITVNVNGGQGAITDTTTHTFQSALAGAVIVGNGFIDGEYIKIADDAFKFTCDKDNNVTYHDYPRASDPSSGRWLKISNCNVDTFDVQVLQNVPSTNTTDHTFVSAVASSIQRSVVTIGGEYNHTFVSAVSGGVTAGGNYTHTFASAKPNSLHRQSGKITVNVNVAATADLYDHTFVSAIPGAVIAGGNYMHSFVSAATGGIEKANSYILIKDGALNFTCDLDDYETEHLYPRDTDHASNEWLAVSNVTVDTFDVQVLKGVPSSFLGKHTFVSCAEGGIWKQDGTIKINVGPSPAGNTYAHRFVSANSGALIQGGNYRHNFVSAASGCIKVTNSGATLTPTDAYYVPTTGKLTLTVAGHSLTTDDTIEIDTNGLTFTCSQDQNATNHTYPRVTDYADGKKLHVQMSNSWAWPTQDLKYFRSRQVSQNYTGTEGAPVETEITQLIQFVTDGLTNPNTVASRSYIMPTVWPVKYTPEVVVRDLTIQYDTAQGGQGNQGTWNQTCQNVASTIATVADIYIQTIAEAANNNVNYLTSNVTKTFPFNSNTIYQDGTCYNVTSAIDTLFDIMKHTLGAGSNNSKNIANMILFNQQAIAGRAFGETQVNWPTTNLTIDFANDVLAAVRYDLVTGGNSGAFELAQQWFDGEGNFIAFPTVVRTHILYCLTRVREYIKSVMYLVGEDAVWNNYDVYVPEGRLEWNQEAVEFMVDSSLNPLEFALERGEFPTEARVQWIASSDAVNRVTRNEVGWDYNTDPALVTLTPEVEVGYDRAEYRIRINQPNNFRRGDVLSYIPTGGQALSGLTNQEYFYCLTATAQWFEIGASYIHDGRFRLLQVDTSNSNTQVFQVMQRSGISRTAPTYPVDMSDTPIQGGFNAADVVYGSTSGSSAEVSNVLTNEGKIYKMYTHYDLTGVSQSAGTYENFINGETVQVQGATSNTGFVLQTAATDDDTGESILKLNSIAGAINLNDVVEGVDSGTTATVGTPSERFLLNVTSGAFSAGDWFFEEGANTEAYMDAYVNKSGSLTGNEGGRITIDVETIDSQWTPGDIIYGSVTNYILSVKGISGTQIQLNQWLHGRVTYELDLGVPIVDTGISDTFNVGDEVTLLQGTVQKNPGWIATVTKYINGLELDPGEPNYGIHKVWIGNLVPVGAGADISEVTQGINTIGKIQLGSNFPTIYAQCTNVTTTNYSSYARVVAIEQAGITAEIWVENAVGDFVDNMSLVSDFGWGGAVTSARTLEGRVDRYFRGFDGNQTIFDLTISNGEAYFPDPAGHLLVFVNGILQPPGGANSYVAYSDKIQFAEPPEIGSQFVGYYVGKLRQLDDISYEFDSLRSSFNLKRQGLFYSLTLTEGVSSNVIRPENNIIVSLNGIIQEPGLAYEIVGSRLIFAEVPRAGSTFVGFSYIGSDADVIAATVVPPVEAGDQLFIEGEEFNREVALIESSNSLITFEYTGSVKGRNAAAIAQITSGKITGANLTNSGDGYTSRPNVDVISSSGFDSRIKALMGITRIDVKTSGVGYSIPNVAIDNVVPDDFTPPEGAPINGGFDVFAGEGTDAGGGGTTIESGTIAILQDPVNVTVNQGQNAAFTVVSSVTNDQTMNYQWQKKEYGTQTWSNIIGANQATYNTSITQQADDGDEYRVAITAAGAIPVYSLSATLSVQTGATILSNFTPDLIFDDN